MTKQFPRLAKTKAELGYLILEDKNTFEEVNKLAHEALVETNMETLPFLLLAFITYFENNKTINSEFKRNIILAYEAYDYEQIYRILQMNHKFAPMLNDAKIVLDSYLSTLKTEK